MALTAGTVEQLAAWCAVSEGLADVRSKTRSEFFGYDEPGTVKYMAQTGDLNARERRFMGWFGFDYKLPDGRHPAELAAVELGMSADMADLTSVTKSVQETRFVMAIVTMVTAGRGVYLALENEEFEIAGRILSQTLHKNDALCAHILPVGRRKWLVCPGWLVWPVRLGPGIRSHLRQFQIDPVKLERFLQQRANSADERPRIKYPHDNGLDEAVSRMTVAAKAEGKDDLIRSVEEWRTMVLAGMRSEDINRFSKQVVKLVGKATSMDDLNRWLALATNIWNNVPQPDRGGRTANEMVAEDRFIGKNGIE
jgi:hypothetical protein